MLEDLGVPPLPTDTTESSPREAQENLRRIRELMERPHQHSTFSGLSGVLAGSASIVGCLFTNRLANRPASEQYSAQLGIWLSVIIFALVADYLLTKRRAATVGKRILSRLGRQMFIAAAPALGTGALLTFYFWKRGLLAEVYPFWMLCYGVAVCAVGLFSRREVLLLGVSFLLLGGLSLFLLPQNGLLMMGLAFGGLHIAYGLMMSRKDGW